MSSAVRERTVEQHLIHQVERIGGLSYKFLSTQAGVPDRIVIFKGLVRFVELKAPGGRLTKIQIWQQDRILRAGVEVAVLYTREDVDHWITGLTSIVDL